ncbi:acetyltransferase [Paraburkholderia caribensis]|uniref:acetyltransferase n=1 Tax=Paraburkholderia caribensis TaxID=75105 RepID=UPI001D074A4E|nr:acetyltransferase [Paraburkholderia caribensis]
MAKRKLVIVGDSAFAEIAREYFDVDTDYEVVAFSVERAYMKQTELHGLPIVPFEELSENYSPHEHDVFVAIVYTQLNRLRTRLARDAKAKGFRLASYVSPRASVWRNVRLGEHVFIFEDNTVQPFVEVGDNVVLWSGNHIGHHSKLRENIFVSSHVVISGFCDIGSNSFLGVNSTIANNIVVGEDNWVGPGTILMKDTEPGALFRAVHAEPAKVTAPRFFKVA